MNDELMTSFSGGGSRSSLTGDYTSTIYNVPYGTTFTVSIVSTNPDMNPGTLNISSGTITGNITIQATEAVPKRQNGTVAGFGYELKATYERGWSRVGWDNSHGSISPKSPLAGFVLCYTTDEQAAGDSGTLMVIVGADPFIRFDIAPEYLNKFNSCTTMVIRIDNVPYRDGICYEQYTIKRSDCVQAADESHIFWDTVVHSSCKYYVKDYTYNTSAPYNGSFQFVDWTRSSNLQITVTFS